MDDVRKCNGWNESKKVFVQYTKYITLTKDIYD